jgi:CheY-like chemotaxis protein
MTDFNMPIMDGIAATNKIRDFLTNVIGLERENQPNIVGVTGHVHD